MTGKTSGVIALQEALNRSRDNEAEEKIQQYKYKKAKRLGIMKDESDFDDDTGRNKDMDLSPEEIKMIKA